MTLDALIVTEQQAASIAAVNAEHASVLILYPFPCADGRIVLPADLLTDCGPGQTWVEYAPLLQAMARETVIMPDDTEE
jgi:hypothetical protein